MKTYWLSFSKPKAALGVVILDAGTENEALRRCNALKLTPPGSTEVLVVDPYTATEDKKIIDNQVNIYGKDRFITPRELDKHFQPLLQDLSKKAREWVDSRQGISGRKL